MHSERGLATARKAAPKKSVIARQLAASFWSVIVSEHLRAGGRDVRNILRSHLAGDKAPTRANRCRTRKRKKRRVPTNFEQWRNECMKDWKQQFVAAQEGHGFSTTFSKFRVPREEYLAECKRLRALYYGGSGPASTTLSFELPDDVEALELDGGPNMPAQGPGYEDLIGEALR